MENYSEQLKAILAQANKKNQNSDKPKGKFEQSELMKKYFLPIVPDGKDDAIFEFRILPEKDNGSPFKEVQFHALKYYSQYLKLLCLKEEDGKECPFCQAYEGLISDGDKEEAKQYRSHTFYIVRGIDRANEAEGVKFWRIKKNFKNKGEFDKILSVINLFGNIIHPTEGYDLFIECARDEKNNSFVRNIVCKKESPISDDPKLVEKWINDDTTWNDIYVGKTVEYLTDVIAGKAQYYDKATKKYVVPGVVNSPKETSNTQSENSEPQSDKSTSVDNNPLLKNEKFDEMIVNNSIEDDDLPF